MAKNLENLMPIEEVNARKTPEERKESARNAGIASGKVRKQKATMKKTLELMLEEIGDKEAGLTYRQMATLGLIKGAIKGNALNYKTIMEVMGELMGQEESNKSNGVLLDLLEALSNAKKPE